MDSTQRFGDRADYYRRYRPSYPAPVIELIRETARLKRGNALADIGSGTGILTRLLLEAGWKVHAVEPNSPMREAAEADLTGFPGFKSLPAKAESTTLPDAYLERAPSRRGLTFRRGVSKAARFDWPGIR